MSRRAIVLIPGYGREERFLRRDMLVRNLATVGGTTLEPGSAVEVQGERGQGLRRQGRLADLPDDLTVFEAYWSDMIPTAADSGPWRKLWQGFELLQYWVLTRAMWAALGIARYATVGLMASGILLVLWYLSLLLLVANALANDPALTEQVMQIPVVGPLLFGALDAARSLGSWKLWATIAFVMGLVNVDGLVARASFIKAYLENTPDETDVGLRDRIRLRARATVAAVLDHGFDEVLIVGHGFGAVIALDILRGLPRGDRWRRLTLVTLGAPLGLLRLRSQWVALELERLMAADSLLRWIDFYGVGDWQAMPVPGHESRFETGASRRLVLEAPLGDRLTTRSHLAYFRQAPVLELLASPLPAAPSQSPNEITEAAPSA